MSLCLARKIPLYRFIVAKKPHNLQYLCTFSSRLLFSFLLVWYSIQIFLDLIAHSFISVARNNPFYHIINFNFQILFFLLSQFSLCHFQKSQIKKEQDRERGYRGLDIRQYTHFTLNWFWLYFANATRLQLGISCLIQNPHINVL